MDGASGAFDPGLAGALRDALDVDGMIAVCQELVRIPSLSGDEAAAARALAGRLGDLGYDRVEIDDKGNVLGWLDGSGNGPTLLCNGHLDHVPPGDMADPYGGQLVAAERWGESGLAIAGRGTCDMKCNVVAAAFGLASVKRAGIPLRRTVVLNADVGEEIDSPDGIQHVLDSLRADLGVSVEATGLRVYLGHRGKVELELAVHGRMAHSSEPSRGENAIARAAPLLQALDRHAAHLAAHPLLGQGTLAAIDIRAEQGGGPEQDLVATACAARADVLDAAGELGAWRFGVNGTFMARAGIPTIGFGPGDERWAHTSEEHVPVDDLIAAARVYARLAIRACGVAA